jgi:hypothetical protein
MIIELVPSSNLIPSKVYYYPRDLNNFLTLPLSTMGANSSGSSYFCNQVTYFKGNLLNGYSNPSYLVSTGSQFVQVATWWSRDLPANATVPTNLQPVTF